MKPSVVITIFLGALLGVACDSRAPVGYTRDVAISRLKPTVCSKVMTCNSSKECCWTFGRAGVLSEQESRLLDQCAEDLANADCSNWQTTYVTDAGFLAVKPASPACWDTMAFCSFNALPGPHTFAGYDPKTWTCE